MVLCSSFLNIIKRIKHKTQRPAPPLKRKIQILSGWVWNFITNCMLFRYLFIFRICLQEKSSPTLAVVFLLRSPHQPVNVLFAAAIILFWNRIRIQNSHQICNLTQTPSAAVETVEHHAHFPNDIWRCDEHRTAGYAAFDSRRAKVCRQHIWIFDSRAKKNWKLNTKWRDARRVYAPSSSRICWMPYCLQRAPCCTDSALLIMRECGSNEFHFIFSSVHCARIVCHVLMCASEIMAIHLLYKWNVRVFRIP